MWRLLDKLFGRALVALLVVMAIATAVVDPKAFFTLVGIGLLGIVLLVAGLDLAWWLWGWRRPTLHRRMRCLVQAVGAAASARAQVLRVELSRSPSSLGHQGVGVVVASDADRDALLDPSFQAVFSQLLSEGNLPYPGQTGVDLSVDSQETVDRDYDGDWFLYRK